MFRSFRSLRSMTTFSCGRTTRTLMLASVLTSPSKRRKNYIGLDTLMFVRSSTLPMFASRTATMNGTKTASSEHLL